MKNLEERLSEITSDIQTNDSELANELEQVRRNRATQNEVHERMASFEMNGDANTAVIETFQPDTLLETIVLRVGRPVLTISQGEAQLEFRDAESQVWKKRLQKARENLLTTVPAVGRIELEHDPYFEWVGTGWLVDKNVIVTNRHVAEVFGRNSGAGYVFRQGVGGNNVVASIDFLEEYNRDEDLTFKIVSILHIEDDNGPDLALLRVELEDEGVAAPIALYEHELVPNQQVAVIGYPARDSRIPDQQLMVRIFGEDVYDKKRLAPGLILESSTTEVLHDCSTLGGNSGSVVLDLRTGKAVGLHFAGRFLSSNYAVPATVIKDRVARYGNSDSTFVSNVLGRSGSRRETSSAGAAAASAAQPHTATFTLPVQISISMDAPVLNVQNHNPVLVANIPPGNRTRPQAGNMEEDEEVLTEGTPQDYKNRQGYNEHFLGKNQPVLLPKVKNQKLKGDVLSFKVNGKKEEVLKYQHFSVVMSKSRRLCFFSAVNIDGRQELKKSPKRGPWRTDPRIDIGAQIMKECYGNPPKFSRGHMTRREDPIWGKPQDAALGNSDSMHVTNAVPQMQPMNAGIWLQLEEYALQNTRRDDMRVCVFTGPVFTEDDPEMYGVAIPLAFWKVIAFIHDRTKKLCATGYRISQEDFIDGREFVFGYRTEQVSIKSIERETGLSFNGLADIDPFGRDTEAALGIPAARTIKRLDQIIFS